MVVMTNETFYYLHWVLDVPFVLSITVFINNQEKSLDVLNVLDGPFIQNDDDDDINQEKK